MHSTTYYRMDPRALEPPSSDAMDSDATDAGRRNLKAVTNARRKTKSNGASNPKKRKTASAWDSDSMSSDTSDEDDDSVSHSNGHSNSSAKRARTGSPSSKSRPAKPEVPNGLKKLPKGYVYDTEINQSALMNLSVNPSQTGEYMEHLKGQQALENNYPDRRSEYGVDLSQEPSMFAVEQQTGYTYPRLRTSGRERLPKPDCEDGYAVADLKHSGGFLGRLFCITDGHGGRACSSFVIATIPGAMQVILGKYKPSDLSVPSIQELVKNQITEAIRVIDKEYLDYKKQQYLLYKAKKIPHDPGSDGTTLIVNIFIDKWMICVNVGDSRSIVSSRDTAGRWNVDFYSEDHTPSLERLAQTIYANGGEFVTHDDKVIKFDPNLKNDKKHRQSLKEARIRVKDGASNLYGIPYRTRNGQAASINLGACIGDVLYKLDTAKPVLSCKPDITFIDVTTIQQGYLLMASDGLWDYVLRGGKVQEQNAAVSQFVGDKLDRGWNHQRIVCTLSDRENMSGLYSDSIQEYDDFTVILVTISNQHLAEKEQEQLAQKEKIRQHEVALLQQQQLQMRRELEEEEQKKEGEGLLNQSQDGVRPEARASNDNAKDESIEAAVTKLPDSDQPAEQVPEDASKAPSELTTAMDMDIDVPDAAPESTSSEIDIDDSAVEQEASSSDAGDLNIIS
ncbi:phosphatase 2C-like domain-containing protein [Dissophora ornata]|nr:phosphatase 2C-like domain-containing protein [Dissophora ornata]